MNVKENSCLRPNLNSRPPHMGSQPQGWKTLAYGKFNLNLNNLKLQKQMTSKVRVNNASHSYLHTETSFGPSKRQHFDLDFLTFADHICHIGHSSFFA